VATRCTVWSRVMEICCYLNKSESVDLRKCPYYHCLTKKVMSQSSELAPRHGGKTGDIDLVWRKIASLSPYVWRVFVCQYTGMSSVFVEVLAEVANKYDIPADCGDQLSRHVWRLFWIHGRRSHWKTDRNYSGQLATYRCSASRRQAR